MDTEDFLSHYGIKGMKWGVRRSKKQLAKANAAKTGAAKKPGVGKRQYDARKLSNKELKSVVNRMKLEQEYASLNRKGTQKSGGKEFASKVMKEHGAKVVGAGLAVGTGLAIGKIMEGKGGTAGQAGELLKKKIAGG